MIWVIFHARCTFCPSIFMTKVLQVLPALGDCHLWMTWEWLTSRCPANKHTVATSCSVYSSLSSQRQHSLQNDLDGKILESSLEMGTKVGDMIIHDIKVMETYMETYQICTFGPKSWHLPRAMTGNLLPVRSFKKIKKRHLAGQGLRYRNDILGLGRQEDWCGLVSFLHVLSPPLPRCWRRYRDWTGFKCWCWPVSNIAGSIFKKYQGKKATAHGPKMPENIKIYRNRTKHAQPAFIFWRTAPN